MLDINVKIVICKEKLRPNDNKIIIGSYKKIKDITSWEPNITLTDTLKDIIKYYN